MEKREIKSISVASVAKNMPLVYFIVGLVVGFASWIYLKYNPASLAPRITFWEWLLAILLYAVIFCVIFTALTVIAALLYNFLSKKMGGIAIKVGQQAADVSSEEQQ